VWKWEQQEPFGAGACNPDPDGDNVQFEFNLRFPGQYFDRETSAHYNYFRDYEPSLGRYVQSDPIGLRGGVNTYLYVAAAPHIFSDPLGLKHPFGWEKLHDQLMEFGIEQGIVQPSPWRRIGDDCGRQICSSGGPRATRSLNLEDLITDLCTRGLTAGQNDSAIEALNHCRKRCEDYFKKNCSSKTGACPAPSAS